MPKINVEKSNIQRTCDRLSKKTAKIRKLP